MGASLFSHLRTSGSTPSDCGPVVACASDGNRISLQSCVVIFLLFDVLAIAGLGLLPTAIGAYYGVYPSPLIDDQALAIGFALFLYLPLARCAATYRGQCILDLRHSLRSLLTALFITFLFLLTLGAASKTTQIYSRIWFFAWVGLTCTLLPAFRVLALASIRDELDKKGAFVFRALSVGIFSDPLSPEEIARRTANQVKTAEALRFEEFGALAGLCDRIVSENIDRIYATVPWADVPVALQHLQLLRKFSAQVFIIPNNEWVRSSRLGVGTFGDLPSLAAIHRPIDGWALWLKRMLDVGVAAFALALLSPLMLGVALAIKIDSRGPIFFRQKRTGFNGTTFEVWKFRSMYVEDTDPDATRQTSKDDPRVTRVGRFIRRSSIDELPQFFNVLQGSMSVVGPRPHALATRAEGRLLEDLVDSYAARHRVRPGLTGAAQVNGLRGEIHSIEKLRRRVEYDIEYIENWSIWLDLKIIARTTMLMIHDSTAY